MTTESATTVEGVLELHPRGHGFLRAGQRSYAPNPADAYVPAGLIQKLALREGLYLSGPVEPPRKGSGPRLTRVAGFEWGTGFYINPVPTEQSATFLREADVDLAARRPA